MTNHYRQKRIQNKSRYSSQVGGYDLQPIQGLGGLGGSPTWSGSLGLSTIGQSPSLAAVSGAGTTGLGSYGTGLGTGILGTNGPGPIGGIDTTGYGGLLGVTGSSGADLYGYGRYGGRTGLGYSSLGAGLYNYGGRYGGFGSGFGYGTGLGSGLLGLGAGLLNGFTGLGTLGYPAGRRWYGYYNSPYIYYNRRPFVYY